MHYTLTIFQHFFLSFSFRTMTIFNNGAACLLVPAKQNILFDDENVHDISWHVFSNVYILFDCLGFGQCNKNGWFQKERSIVLANRNSLIETVIIHDIAATYSYPFFWENN